MLQKTSDENKWEEYLLYMLKGVEETSTQTIEIIRGIRDLMQRQKGLLKTKLPKIYSQDLLNNIFMHPYTRVSALSQALSVQGRTAKKYLDELESIGILEKKVLNKKSTLYINVDLMKLLSGLNKDREI